MEFLNKVKHFNALASAVTFLVLIPLIMLIIISCKLLRSGARKLAS